LFRWMFQLDWRYIRPGISTQRHWQKCVSGLFCFGAGNYRVWTLKRNGRRPHTMRSDNIGEYVTVPSGFDAKRNQASADKAIQSGTTRENGEIMGLGKTRLCRSTGWTT
jgi:hypothetical protein